MIELVVRSMQRCCDSCAKAPADWALQAPRAPPSLQAPSPKAEQLIPGLQESKKKENRRFLVFDAKLRRATAHRWFHGTHAGFCRPGVQILLGGMFRSEHDAAVQGWVLIQCRSEPIYGLNSVISSLQSALYAPPSTPGCRVSV